MRVRATIAVVAAGVCISPFVLAQSTPATRPASTTAAPSTDAGNPNDFLEQSNQQLRQRQEEMKKLEQSLGMYPATRPTTPAAPPAAATPPPATASPAPAPATAASAPAAPAPAAPAPAATPGTNAGANAPSSTRPLAEVPLGLPATRAVTGTPQRQGSVIVTYDRDIERNSVPPSLGANVYTIGQPQIASIPGGDNASFQQILLREPGVVEDSFGQVHVRGEHANVTYVLDGIFLPQGLEGFGQELDPRLVNTTALIDGALPAQFGFRTAGIINVDPKTGDALNSNEISIYGGSRETFEPSAQFGGTVGKLDYFTVISGNQSQLGIENTTSSTEAIHDRTDLTHFFSYLSYHLGSTSRIDLIINLQDQNFQIPDTAGVPAAYPLAGHPNALTADSAGINENQNEQTYYGIAAYKKNTDQYSFQLAYFVQDAAIHFTPDEVNDLIFQGVAGDVRNTFLTNGAQADFSVKAGDHTIRAGFLGYYTNSRLETSTAVFDTDPATGAPVSDVPVTLDNHSGNHGVDAGIYIEDEWRLTKKLTLNYGGRYDRFDANFLDAGQFSPRVNLVYQPDPATTLHAGYSRYFVPPPFQYVGPTVVDKFANTTNAPDNFGTGQLKPERSNYYDIGVERQISKRWKVNVDGFYKQANNLLDDGQFGAPVIITPFNYRYGQVWGTELSSSYNVGGWSAFGNFSYVNTLGNDIISQQYLIDNDELAYIRDHWIKLDHEGEYTASLGASYRWSSDMVYVDALYGSGLRRGFANLGKEPEYFPVNIGWMHLFHITNSRNVVKLRFDITNVFNESYQLRDGSGVGVAAPQYGPRRGFFAGLSYVF